MSVVKLVNLIALVLIYVGRITGYFVQTRSASTGAVFCPKWDLNAAHAQAGRFWLVYPYLCSDLRSVLPASAILQKGRIPRGTVLRTRFLGPNEN